MTVNKIYFKVRDLLVAWGVVEGPRFYMQRHAAGSVRGRLTGRGTRKRIRRLALPVLMRL
jgi:hypothetical protein